jgi:hypothetical protein
VIPEEIKLEFSNSDKWPMVRYHGIIEILLGVEYQDIQPQCLEVRKNLSPTTILGGSHEKIVQPIIKLSKMCKWIKVHMTQDSKETSACEALTGKR